MRPSVSLNQVRFQVTEKPYDRDRRRDGKSGAGRPQPQRTRSRGELGARHGWVRCRELGERGLEFGSGLIARVRVDGERFRDHVRHVRRHLGVVLVGPEQPSAQKRNQLERIGRRERTMARGHLVEHDAEAVDIRTMVDRAAVQLLRRHVRRRARLRDRACLRGGVPQAGRRLTRQQRNRLRHAEVEHLHRTIPHDLNVGGLQVAVDDAFRVGGAERRSELAPNRQRSRQGDALAPEFAGEAVALDVFQHEIRPSVVLDDVVDGRDVRMIDAAGGARFVEQLAAQVFFRLSRRQAFHGDLAVQVCVGGKVDLAHAAFAELVEDDVTIDPHARGQIDVGLIRRHEVGNRRHRSEEVLVRLLEERVDFAPQVGIGTVPVEIRRPLADRQLEHLSQNRLGSSPGIGVRRCDVLVRRHRSGGHTTVHVPETTRKGAAGRLTRGPPKGGHYRSPAKPDTTDFLGTLPGARSDPARRLLPRR